MPVFNPALLQELVTQVTGIVQSSPLNAARLVPLALPVQQLYESALAEYLLQTVTTFVELHPPAPGDHARLNSNAQTSLVMVLHDLLSLQSITPALHTRILNQFFSRNRGDQFGWQNPHVDGPPLNAPSNQVLFHPPRHEVPINPPIRILDSQTVQQSVRSQLTGPHSQSRTGPNSQSSTPNHHLHGRRTRYESISHILPPVPGGFDAAKIVLESVFSGCPHVTDPVLSVFRSRPGHLKNQRNWFCRCELVVQGRYKEDNGIGAVHFFLPKGQDLPHQGSAPEAAVITNSGLSFEPHLTPEARLLARDMQIFAGLTDNQKDAIKSILEAQPTVQPLVCWSLLRRILPLDTLFQFESGGIRGYYVVQAYIRSLRRSTLPIVGFGYRVLDFASIGSFIDQNSIFEHLRNANYSTPRSIYDFRSLDQMCQVLRIHDAKKIFTVPVPDAFITSLRVNEHETTRARAHILLMNAGSIWAIILYLKQPENQRILTMDFSTGYLADNASVGQVCALQLLVDHYDKSKLRQRAHPLAYSLTYETKAMVRVAHHLIGLVASTLFVEPMTVAREIADRSLAIVRGTNQAHPGSVVYPCLIHYRLSPHNSPSWRKYMRSFKTFEVYLQIFINRLTTVYRTDVVRKKALVHFASDCRSEDINEPDFCDFFMRNFGADKPLFYLLSIFSIHMAGYKMDNQAHESGYRKQKGSSRLGVPPIGRLNQSVSGFLGNTVRELMGHDLARVTGVSSFQLDSSLRLGNGYTIPQTILCEVALSDPHRDVRAITHQDLRALCPEICDTWFGELGVDLRSPLTLCWLVNGLPTFGRTIDNDRVVRFLRLHFDENYNPYAFNRYYEQLSYDLFIVFQAKTDMNPELVQRKAVDLFGLFCWRCHDFQSKGLCTSCLLVQEFRGELSPSLTTYLSVVYANRPGTARGRVNPLYARSRTSVVNRTYHDQFGLPPSTPLVPLEYLANRSIDVLAKLRKKMFKVTPDFYRVSTAHSKAFLLLEVVAGTSLGSRIVDLITANGTTDSPFITRHATIRATTFPSQERERIAEYAHYPYPPIRDPHSPSSCTGFYSGCYIATRDMIHCIRENLPIALALLYLLDQQIIIEDDIVARTVILCNAVAQNFGTHLLTRVPFVKEAIFNQNEGQMLQEQVSTHELDFVLSQNLGASLHLHESMHAFVQGIDMENKRLSFVFRVCNKHFPIFRIKLSRIWEYHLFNHDEVHHDNHSHGVRILCCNDRSLFRLLHRISVYENFSLGENQSLSRVSRRSTLFRFCVEPTIQSGFEMIADLTNRLGTTISEISTPDPEVQVDEEGEVDAAELPSADATAAVTIPLPGIDPGEVTPRIREEQSTVNDTHTPPALEIPSVEAIATVALNVLPRMDEEPSTVNEPNTPRAAELPSVDARATAPVDDPGNDYGEVLPRVDDRQQPSSNEPQPPTGMDTNEPSLHPPSNNIFDASHNTNAGLYLPVFAETNVNGPAGAGEPAVHTEPVVTAPTVPAVASRIQNVTIQAEVRDSSASSDYRPDDRTLPTLPTVANGRAPNLHVVATQPPNVSDLAENNNNGNESHMSSSGPDGRQPPMELDANIPPAAIRPQSDSSTSSDELPIGLANRVPNPRLPNVPAVAIRPQNVPDVPAPAFREPNTRGNWPTSLHVENFRHLEIVDLVPWNQLPLGYAIAANDLREQAGLGGNGVFVYFTRIYASQIVDPTILSWLLESAPQKPDVVANVEQNIYNLLVERDIASLQDGNWLNDNVINFMLDRLVHFQASRSYTGRLTYMYDTRFLPVVLWPEPMLQGRISKQSRLYLRPYTEAQSRGGGSYYQDENILDAQKYKFVFIPCHDGSMHWQFVVLVPRLKIIFFGDPYGLAEDSPELTSGTSHAANVLNRVEEFVTMCERHHNPRRAQQPWQRRSFYTFCVQFDGKSCGLFGVLVPYLLIHLSILRPSCDELSIINFVRNFSFEMQLGSSQNAAVMRNWIVFSIATNQIIPNGKQVATRSFPSLGQPISVDDGSIEQDVCSICLNDLVADNLETPLVVNLNRNCTHKLHLECATRLLENNEQTPQLPVDVYNELLHPLAACPICKRGGGWAYATSRQLLRRNLLGWRRKLMIRTPLTERLTEARFEWRHRYASFRVDSGEDERYTLDGDEMGQFTLNRTGGYHLASCDWVVVDNRNKWNRLCIELQRPDLLCLPTGSL